MSNILIVLSAADTWTRADGSLYPTGYWAEEFVDIHEVFLKAGHAVAVATPGGIEPTADPKSLSAEVVGDEKAARFTAYLQSLHAQLSAPLDLADIDVVAYDAIVVPGGHGPVEDLYKDADMGRVFVDADASGKIIAAVCHGQAALLSAQTSTGEWLFDGRKLTAFSDEEEVEFGTADNAPWLLARRLRENGALYEKGPNWEPYVVTDGKLVTGQNPASSALMAETVVAQL